MEEQKLSLLLYKKQQMNVQKIKSVAVWYSLKSAACFKSIAGKEQHKCAKNYKLNSHELVWR